MNAVRITSSVGERRLVGHGRRGHERPDLRAGVGVERGDQRGQGDVAVLGPSYLAEFSISSRDSTSAPRELIARTSLSSWRCRSASSQAPRGPSGPQSSTVTGSPARSLKLVQVCRRRPRRPAGLGEEVEHVEAGDPEVAVDVLRRRGAGVRERDRLHRGRVGRGELAGRLELPEVVAVVEDHRPGEVRDRADTDRGVPGDPRQRLARVRGGQVVRRRAVVERDRPGGVVVGHGLGRGRPGPATSVGCRNGVVPLARSISPKLFSVKTSLTVKSPDGACSMPSSASRPASVAG